MAERIKKQISSKTLLCKIALVMLMGFSLIACNKQPIEKKVSGTVTAEANGIITFKYSRQSSNSPNTCTFTTNLPAPNDQFVLTITSGNTAGDKVIEGLTAGQKVEWTAKVKGNPLNHGSGNFVHIIND
ncbi:MAG: hypothetical protein FWC34_10170 [Bacteroidetes bacterium]|nr:hypothetical protein [Bacteroidota bacterium]MCL2302147.1 hypothetical protein [Lentimicrobiaceae bacterium]